MDDKNEACIRFGEDTEFPCEGHNDPGRKISERYTDVPRSASVWSDENKRRELTEADAYNILAESKSPIALMYSVISIARSPATEPGS